ncbi:hypothetical protein BN1723_001233 [Verticillium longisporum]|uniref:FAD/NAD(P)-binding domain-containing protein n=1 Tax=Verticillium longisporum TaxID=100787 RepID=A0A0G4NKJ5_VERLO|nr:hypothetical protein BN1723_001233 [Verticillium longisporum]
MGVAANPGSGAERTIAYDALVIATGSRARDDMPWKELGTTDQTKARLGALRKQIAAANKIVVAGGGTTGVEVAGEVGFEFGRKKDVYFVIDKELPLGDNIREDVRRLARKELEKLGVKVIDRSKVTGAREDGTGKTILQLTNASGATSELEADAYLPTFGLVPNTSFVPANLLDKNGLVRQNTEFKVPGYDSLGNGSGNGTVGGGQQQQPPPPPASPAQPGGGLGQGQPVPGQPGLGQQQPVQGGGGTQNGNRPAAGSATYGPPGRMGVMGLSLAVVAVVFMGLA